MRYIKRVLDISHDLERKSQFLFGPRQTGKTSWIREELDGVSYCFNLLDKKLVKALQDDPALFAGMLRREGIDSGLVVVDEIQKLPFLLDEVHNLIESTDIRFLLCVFAIGNQQKYQKNSALFPKPQFIFFSTI